MTPKKRESELPEASDFNNLPQKGNGRNGEVAIPLPELAYDYDDDDDKPAVQYEPSRAEKIINILLCRYQVD